jgi:hypothetical protein
MEDREALANALDELQRAEKERGHSAGDVEREEGMREPVGEDRFGCGLEASEVSQDGHHRDFQREQDKRGAQRISAKCGKPSIHLSDSGASANAY